MPKFYYKGVEVHIDELFRMAGELIASVTAKEAIFRTDPRPNAPCRATAFGWVRARDLAVQLPLPFESVAQVEVAQ